MGRKLAVARFVDKIRIVAYGGHGGNGCASFFRDSRVERGPADGGSGGKGGSVFVRASKHVGDLTMAMTSYRAKSGTHGSGSGMNGARGKDTTLEVPCGTTIECLGVPTRAMVPRSVLNTMTPTFMADLLKDGDTALVSNGGGGGRGNVALRAGRLQSSRLAEDGVPGDQVGRARPPTVAAWRSSRLLASAAPTVPNPVETCEAPQGSDWPHAWLTHRWQSRTSDRRAQAQAHTSRRRTGVEVLKYRRTSVVDRAEWPAR